MLEEILGHKIGQSMLQIYFYIKFEEGDFL